MKFRKEVYCAVYKGILYNVSDETLKNTLHLSFSGNISKLTDEELLQRYRESGKTDYFGELYNRYLPLLYGVCLKYLRQTEAAQDAVMQLFEELIPKVCKYEIGNFRTWLHSVVRNHCLQLLRQEPKEISLDFTLSVMESEEFPHLYLWEEEQPDEEKLVALNHCLERLPDKQRVSIVHFYMEEMSYADIAEKTGYAVMRVKSYIQNGKRNLSICIEKHLK